MGFGFGSAHDTRCQKQQSKGKEIERREPLAEPMQLHIDHRSPWAHDQARMWLPFARSLLGQATSQQTKNARRSKKETLGECRSVLCYQREHLGKDLWKSEHLACQLAAAMEIRAALFSLLECRLAARTSVFEALCLCVHLVLCLYMDVLFL